LLHPINQGGIERAAFINLDDNRLVRANKKTLVSRAERIIGDFIPRPIAAFEEAFHGGIIAYLPPAKQRN